MANDEERFGLNLESFEICRGMTLDVKHTGIEDLPVIYQFFDDSILYQERNAYPSWRNYDKDAIVSDIKNKNQFKILIDAQIAIVFSIRYSDKIIWRSLDRGDSMYLHRIVINPSFKGKKLFGEILKWSIEHAKARQLHSIRMDTWADNPRIIDYYKTFGFHFVEYYTTPDTTELPTHNRNLPLALLEYRL